VLCHTLKRISMRMPCNKSQVPLMHTKLVFCAVCVAVIIFCSPPTNGRTQDRDLVLSINGPRPLDEAVDQLESKLKKPISYEDVALIYSGDYARPLDTVWGRKVDERDDRFRANNTIVLAGGALDIHIPADAAGKPSVPISQVLWELIDQHKARGNPGQFRLISAGDALVIVPTAKGGVNGMLVPEYSPLDSDISFPVEKRSGGETLEAICKAVTTASGRRVTLGMLPRNLSQQTTIELGADPEIARDVLMKALRGLRWADGRKFPDMPKAWSWRLLYGPEKLVTTTPTLADGFYALNLRSFQ
jgi:hypothetical protein